RGVASAGRTRSEVNVSTGVILQISEDRELARREAAMQVAFYATTRTYAPVLARHGHEDRVGPLREAFGRSDFESMIDLALPMVDHLAISGTAGECRESLAAFEGVADRLILGGTWVGT